VLRIEADQLTDCSVFVLLRIEFRAVLCIYCYEGSTNSDEVDDWFDEYARMQRLGGQPSSKTAAGYSSW
jgi:hypothetical protein